MLFPLGLISSLNLMGVKCLIWIANFLLIVLYKIMWSFQNCPVGFLFSPPVPFLLCLPFTVLSFLGTGPHTVLSLQLSPEEGYVSAKEESFLYPPHSSEDEGLTDAALFRADLALVSGDASQAFFTSLCLDLPSRICWRDFVILKAKLLWSTQMVLMV